MEEARHPASSTCSRLQLPPRRRHRWLRWSCRIPGCPRHPARHPRTTQRRPRPPGRSPCRPPSPSSSARAHCPWSCLGLRPGFFVCSPSEPWDASCYRHAEKSSAATAPRSPLARAASAPFTMRSFSEAENWHRLFGAKKASGGCLMRHWHTGERGEGPGKNGGTQQGRGGSPSELVRGDPKPTPGRQRPDETLQPLACR